MSWRVAILCAESRTEGIYLSKSRCTEFAFELSTHRQTGHLPEEIVRIVDFSVLIFLQVVEILRRHLKHLARTLCIACGDERRVEIEESVFVKVLVNGYCHMMPYAHHGSESISAQTQMSVLPHIFEALTFFLHRIVGSTAAVERDVSALYLGALSLSLTFHQHTRRTDTSTGSDLFQQFGIKACRVYHQLHILNGRTVVEGDKIHRLTAAMRSNPSFYVHGCPEIGAAQHVYHLCSLKFIHSNFHKRSEKRLFSSHLIGQHPIGTDLCQGEKTHLLRDK